MKEERVNGVSVDVITNLKFLLKTYDGTKKQLVRAKQRLKSMNREAEEKHQDEIKWMKSQKDRLKRKIAKELELWPIWTEWMKQINGIGPFIAGNLIMLYYYRFVPICHGCLADLNDDFECPECGKKAKGHGLLTHRVEGKDFRRVSSWWHYLGEHNDSETGRMARRKAGQKSDWSNLGRNISWNIGEAFNKLKNGHKYKAFYNQKKEDGKRHGDAIRRTRKLFLSHFWHVARELAGESTEGPYVANMPGHNVIPPYYWKPKR